MKRTLIIIISMFVLGFLIGAWAAIADQEYMITLANPTKPKVIVGVVKVGMNKRQAEGAAFQLNETLKERKLPLVASARKLVDVKAGAVENSQAELDETPCEAKTKAPNP
jgi:hypothetical protein